MNKRYYEHTLPIIRGSLSNTYERFDSNRPGKKNVWKNNGPQVADSIKYKAGRIKQD